MILRTACVILAAVTLRAGPARADDWIPLFDGKTLEGWTASEKTDTFSVKDGAIIAAGGRSHLYYTGPVHGANFQNFTLRAQVMTRPESNSGIIFHTRFRGSGWPDAGHEVQINNTYPERDGYYDYKKTGSLYGIRNQYVSPVKDDEWFTMLITVRGPRITVALNNVVVVDYSEPLDEPSSFPRGTFALQGHDPKSTVLFREIAVQSLPDALEAEAPATEPYPQFRAVSRANFPLVDFHVHLKGGLTLDEALAQSRATGVTYGIAANCGRGFPITDDSGIDRFLSSVRGRPIFVGMQAEGREWPTMFSKGAIARFDYVFTDAMTWTDDQGHRMRLWIDDEVVIGDPQQFMDTLVKRIVDICDHEPIDIYVNPTFLPIAIASQYDTLWTPERMQAVIDAAARNRIAIEINAHYQLPSRSFIERAKAAGVRFTFGTNNGDRNLGDLGYCLRMMRDCKLTAADMFLPRPDGQKPIQTKNR
jgi:hypothetical protein